MERNALGMLDLPQSRHPIVGLLQNARRNKLPLRREGEGELLLVVDQ